MQNLIKKVGIVYNSEISESKCIAEKINSKLENSIVFSLKEMDENIDIAIIVGGDGTFLKASRFYSRFSIPILGFNVGRLGYLSQANPDEIDNVIEKLKNQNYKIEKRIMLKAGKMEALNDIVVKGTNYARTSTLELYINDKKLCSYVADGLIISTPTGSTAYSLSAGGPIISPSINCFLIVPICPHTLNTRPLIIPTNEKIKIKTCEINPKLNVSYDGQVDIIVDNEIEIEKNETSAELIILNKHKDRFYDILKEKLYWSLPLNLKR